MNIEVRFFAVSRELVRAERCTQQLPEGAALEDLREVLFRAFPGLEKQHLQFAVNLSYAPLTTILHDGDEVACIPPVGGG